MRSAGKSRHDRGELALDEHALAIERIDVAVGDFAVNREHHAVPLHRRECCGARARAR
jgi:hypothetical protein